jgi:hypothetical protein
MPEHAARKATADTLVPLPRSKASAQETAMIVEQSYVAASKGAVEFNLKLIDIAEDNVNASFDFARQLPHITSPSVFFELSAEHTCKQFERLAAQTQELTKLAQTAIAETAQCLQVGVSTLDERLNK